MEFENEAERQYDYDQNEDKDKKKKKRIKYERIVIERTDDNYINQLRSKHIFRTNGKGIVIVIEPDKPAWKQICDQKLEALSFGREQKKINQSTKVKLLLEV